MKPPVEEFRISIKGRETLIKLKKRTGLTQWNHLCRAAWCRSLCDPTVPGKPTTGDGVRMEWKTFSGAYSDEFSCMHAWRATADGVDLNDRDALAENFRAHIERGIDMLSSIADLEELVALALGIKSIGLDQYPDSFSGSR